MTKTLTPIFVLTILVSFFFATANAQVSDGELVRVRTVDGNKIVGTVSEVTTSGLGLSFPSGGSENISYGEMSSLHRSIGRRTYRKRATLIGAGTGVLIGVAFGILADESCETVGFDEFDEFDDACDEFGLAAGLLASAVYGAGGALIGLGVGSLIKGERWQEVSVPGMGSMSFEPRIGVRPNGSPVIGVRMIF